MISPVQLLTIALGLIVTGHGSEVTGAVNFTCTIVPTEILAIDWHDLGMGYEAVVARLDKANFQEDEKTPLLAETIRYAGDEVLFISSATDPELEVKRFRHDDWPRAIPWRFARASARLARPLGGGSHEERSKQ